MACEQEWQAMTNAALALDTSVIALEQQAAIVSSNAQAAMQATMNYETCMNNQGMMADPELSEAKMNIGKVEQHSRQITTHAGQAKSFCAAVSAFFKRLIEK